MTNKQAENCLLLAAFLRDDPRVQKEHRLHMPYWVGKTWKGRTDLSCGTSACAAGWASTIPDLRDQGLVLNPVEEGGGYVSLEMLVQVFGREAMQCFHAQQPNDPDYIADLLEEVVREALNLDLERFNS